MGARTALPRQQTLRAVVDWSYDLLFEDERRLFARLSVFVGGCDLDSAEAVCADDQVPTGEVLDVLSRLVDKSLVAAPDAGRDARFVQLQTLWRYGRDRLGESGEADAMCARHGAYYRQMAHEAHEGLRGATGPRWRERLTSELGNLRAALDWFIARGDADAALSLASGMAWLWFINSDCVEGARWLGDALAVTGPRRPELAATAQVLHGYFVCGYFVGMALSPAAAVLECEEAVAALTTSDDRVRRAEALVLCATVLMRAHEFERSLGALSEAHDLLEPAVHGWQLALHDLILAWNLALLGRLDDAEPAAHSSVERFDAQGEVWLPVDSLSILALIAEAQGDLDRASAAYEALLERCRATGQRGYVLFSLLRLAALRGRQGDDAAADGLYEQAIACSFNPSVSADAMVGQAAAVRRLGDLARARALLDAAGNYYRDVDLPAGQTAVLAGLAWWALSAGEADDARVFVADASQAAAASGDPAIQLLAETAVAAVRALADPTRHNVESLVALAQQRAQSLPYRTLTSFTDEPDVTALAARLALPGR
jgi:tetratricopeptide (TPR) repeat protein